MVKHKWIVDYQVGRTFGRVEVWLSASSETSDAIAAAKRKIGNGLPMPIGLQRFTARRVS